MNNAKNMKHKSFVASAINCYRKYTEMDNDMIIQKLQQDSLEIKSGKIEPYKKFVIFDKKRKLYLNNIDELTWKRSLSQALIFSGYYFITGDYIAFQTLHNIDWSGHGYTKLNSDGIPENIVIIDVFSINNKAV